MLGHQAESELGRGGGREDGFGSFALVAAGQPIDLGRGADADALETRVTLLAIEQKNPGLALVIGFSHRERGQHFSLGRRDVLHIVIEAGHRDATAGVVERGENFDQRGGRIDHRATENSRV